MGKDWWFTMKVFFFLEIRIHTMNILLQSCHSGATSTSVHKNLSFTSGDLKPLQIKFPYLLCSKMSSLVPYSSHFAITRSISYPTRLTLHPVVENICPPGNQHHIAHDVLIN